MNLDETGTLSTKNCLLSQQAVSTLKIRSKQETFDETIETNAIKQHFHAIYEILLFNNFIFFGRNPLQLTGCGSLI